MILNCQAPAVWVREAVQLIYALQRQVKKAGSGQALDFVVQPTAVSTIRVPLCPLFNTPVKYLFKQFIYAMYIY